MNSASGSEASIRVLVIGAHPDEPDIYAGGTAALFAMAGHAVKFLSLTDGCGGHYEMDGEALSERRTMEAQEAARRLGIAEYEVLRRTHDGELYPDVATRLEVVRQIRRWQADIVITFHPEGCKHTDNRYAGRVVADAASFAGSVRNVAPDVPLYGKSPLYLLMPDYSMRDRYSADIVVDIGGEALERKLRACDAHASQFYEYTPWTQGRLNEVPERWEERREFLLDGWAPFFYSDANMLPALERWYGADHAGTVLYAEPFEIADYGRRPEDAELRRLLPMLGDASGVRKGGLPA
ncbi:PIG-L deacetylase family protein [Cohnella hashimotonis]|uniref:PIG-L family deacetylase n=1 Tax=Cohnella hashimotonis TaxID=2826895 RepID=A0ABT6T9J5_9BACL|nr:PIG-L deacetylase family protein [Cohnella hashimotonis]MDI4643496.1 PIG-L family deacetylase [Cohnella hashimotonis]